MGNRGQDLGPERGGWEAIDIQAHGEGRNYGHCMNITEAICKKDTMSAAAVSVLFQGHTFIFTLLA